MSSPRLLDYDPLTGIKTEFIDGEGETFHIRQSQDVQPFIDANKRAHATGKEYWRSGGDWRHEATIPLTVQMIWLEKYGIQVWNPEHQKDVVKRLNDPEWKYLKTAEIII